MCSEEKGTLWENDAFVDKPVSVRARREAVALQLIGHPRVEALPAVGS
jgi:hypothetical protein